MPSFRLLAAALFALALCVAPQMASAQSFSDTQRTDIEGIINNLDACAPGWDGAGEALVLGAGGSSRAVVFGLIERGIARVHLVNRTHERAQRLADERVGGQVKDIDGAEPGRAEVRRRQGIGRRRRCPGCR